MLSRNKSTSKETISIRWWMNMTASLQKCPREEGQTVYGTQKMHILNN